MSPPPPPMSPPSATHSTSIDASSYVDPHTRAIKPLTACGASQYQSAAPTLTKDRECTEQPTCKNYQVADHPGDSMTRRTCKNKCTASEYYSSAGTCKALTVCPAGRAEIYTPTSDRDCDSVTVILAWESRREPTPKDKLILYTAYNHSAPKKRGPHPGLERLPGPAWSCNAQSLFKSHKEVHARLPPGNYNADTSNGKKYPDDMQYDCSLKTNRRVAFADTKYGYRIHGWGGGRCSQAVSTTSAEIDLAMCEKVCCLLGMTLECPPCASLPEHMREPELTSMSSA